jgi:hypothetical protein
MPRQPINFCLICLVLVAGCALTPRRNNAELAEQPQNITPANPRWVRYEWLDEHPVAKFVCAVGLKVTAAMWRTFEWVMDSADDDGQPDTLDQALDEAAQAKKAEQWRLEQSAKIAAQRQAAPSR